MFGKIKSLQIKNQIVNFAVAILTFLFSLSVYKGKNIDQIKILSSLDCDLTNLILSDVKEAKNHVHVESFTISNKNIISTLNKLKNKKIEIFCRSQGRKKKSSLMHRKLIIIDREKTLLPSLNLSRKSDLKMQTNTLIAITDQCISEFLCDKNKYFLEKKISKNIEVKIWKTNKNATALNEILNDIENAKRNIKIAMFRLSHKDVIEKLKSAKKRNIQLTILTDKKNKSLELNSNDFNLKTLNKMMLHNKLVVIDEKTVWAGSANWTKRGLEINEEIIIRIQTNSSHNVIREASRIIDQLCSLC